MIQQRFLIPSAGGYEVPLDAYIPDAYAEIAPDIRRPAVVICPGGGYRHLSPREAEPVALRFVTEGFNAFVVHYRTAPDRYPLPQQDVAAAIACVRRKAEKWHTHPARIAVMGFSAGAHAAGSVGVLWHRAELWREMGLAPEMVRPNAMALCYPVITAEEHAHRGSFENLTGTADVETHQAHSLEKLVTPDCPPTFLWHTFEDQSVPVQNSLLMASALAEHGVLAEMHIFPHGGHGASLCSRLTAHEGRADHVLPECECWPQMASRFMKDVMK